MQTGNLVTMMKRIDKVYQKLLSNLGNLPEEELLLLQGLAAKEIADQLKMERSNVSFELNNLVRAKKVLKIKTFPVRYIPIEVVNANLHVNIPEGLEEVKTLFLLVDKQSEKEKKYQVKTNPFQTMIGANSSLKRSISQAKAAIYYPPHGLHMLFLGETGSGKTLFANRVYQYAIYSSKLEEGAPYITFNCADYYNNPQLLLSQLFGHVKGAYTGADEERKGLVEQADSGILFLDEVHRLPPEGQEMLFEFIDNGTYNRLGETDGKRQSKVLIICATTENPNSTLLKTFLRRIPMSIHIPSFEERSIKEKIELVTFLLGKEAERIKKNLKVHVDVINELIHSVKFGNIGQLKSNVQLTCAHGFLNNIINKKIIELTVKDLPEEIKQDWIHNRNNMDRSKEILEYVDVMTNVSPVVEEKIINLEEENPFNLYQLIEEKVGVLKEEGMSDADINQYILTDIHLYVKSFFNQKAFQNYKLAKFVEDDIIQLTKELKVLAEDTLNCKFDRKFIYFVSMHIDAYFKRGNQVDLLSPLETNKIRNKHPREYQVGLLMKERIKDRFNIVIPELEVIYLTMLVQSIESLVEKKRVGIIVAMHGNSSASSMVDVATELLGDAPIAAVDMPLTSSPADMINDLVKKINEVDEGKGVLMLVDMGSLTMLENNIKNKTNINIKTINNVTTAMILDTVRKVNYLDLDLNGVCESVNKDFIELFQQKTETLGRKKAIVAICTTGSGTAKKLKEMLTSIVYQASEEPIEIITASTIKLNKQLMDIQKKYEILITVGTKNPKINVPHISLEVLIESNGEEMIRQTINTGLVPLEEEGKHVVVRNLCEDSLKQYLLFLNPYRLTDMLLEWIVAMQDETGVEYSNTLIIKVVMHTAFVFERVVKKNQLIYTETDGITDTAIYETVKDTLKPYQNKLGLEIDEGELAYIAHIFLDEQ